LLAQARRCAARTVAVALCSRTKAARELLPGNWSSRRGAETPPVGRRVLAHRARRRPRPSVRAAERGRPRSAAPHRLGAALAACRGADARVLGGRLPGALPPRQAPPRGASRGARDARCRCPAPTPSRRSDIVSADPIIGRLAAANPFPSAAPPAIETRDFRSRRRTLVAALAAAMIAVPAVAFAGDIGGLFG